MIRHERLAVISLLALALGCAGADTQTTAQAPAPSASYPPPYASAPASYPPSYASAPASYPPPYASAPASYPPPYASATATAPPPVATPPPLAAPRALLLPLVGTPALQAEVRLVLDELIRNLAPGYQNQVRGIPLKFETDPNEINAYAGCEQGASFMAATQGILDVIDALAQTTATDELYGTKTYEAYAAAVLPILVQPKGGSAALSPTLVPVAYALDPRRLSRAHEIADDVIAFTFGHELAHHYLGHTGCANGATPLQQGLAVLGHLGTQLVPVFNQPNELAADNVGLFNVMDSGRARRPLFEWDEKGGLTLLDFFARMEKTAGASPLVAFLHSHPASKDRITWITAFAASWRQQHP